MADYAFRAVGVGDDDCRAAAGLFGVVWPKARQLTTDYVRWMYAENPAGPAIGFNAWAGDKLAGHYVVTPIRAALSGTPVAAALSLNTAVHPDHQGRGLFTKLAQQTYALARSQGLQHVIGVGNAKSTPGLVRKLDFRLIRPLDVRLTWGWPRADEEPGPEACSWRRIWTPEDLRWRLRNPALCYTAAWQRGCRQILAPTGRCGILAVLKVDRGAAQDAASDLPRPPPGRIKLWMGLSRRVRMPRAGALPLPVRLRPSPLNLVIRYLSGGEDVVRAETVEFEALDFDAY